ncbi:hypothetical protein EKK58_08500 [Candidatus Dependentiae bacterium]|nr:MAG: hypothetical protein EKK58_08500 [Candidatus Dependentiae bacterium]
MQAMLKDLKLREEVLNKLVAKVAAKQNDNNRLNAGELREMISLSINALVELIEEMEKANETN